MQLASDNQGEKGIFNIMDKLIEILQDIRPDVDFETENEMLVDGGVLESLDIVTLVGEINFTFNIEIGQEDMTAENFNSVEAMWDLISSLQDQADDQ